MPALMILRILPLFAAAAGLAAAAERPNILWLTSEDNAAHWVGAYGNERAQTPRIDALAESGVLFENAYSNAAVCAVARSSLLMGAWAPTVGTQHMRSRHPIPDRFKPYVSYLREAGYYCTNRHKTDYNFRGTDESWWDDSSTKAHYKNRPENAPFFAIFNFTTTHESSLFPDRDMTPRRVKPEEIEVPPYLPDLPAVRTDLARYHDRMTAMDGEIGAALDELEAAGLADDTIVFYYSDHGGPTPRGKRYLEDTGVKVPLIVHFPEKWAHLSPWGAGTRVAEPVSFVDLAPTLLSILGLETPDQMQGRALFGPHRKEPAADEMEFLFADRFDEFYGMRRGLTDGRWKYIRRFTPHLPAAPYSLYQFSMPSWAAWRKAWENGALTGYAKELWEAPQASEQLFDTRADPWEVKNLANDPAHAGRLAAMRARLRETMAAARDTGVVPEPMFMTLTQDRPVADFVRAEGFDDDGVLDLAFAASSADPAEEANLVAALASDDPVKRYWAVLGLLVLGDEAKEHAEKVEPLLEDSELVIRATAARAMIAWGRVEQGRQALLAALEQGGDDFAVLSVLGTLRETGMLDAIPLEWAKAAAAAQDSGEYVRRFAEVILKERS